MRDLVIAKKKLRRIEVNNNLIRYNEKVIEPATYPESFEGIILSYSDRFPATKKLLDQIISEWDKTKSYLRV